MEATGISPLSPFLPCPGKPSAAWSERERMFEMFLVAAGDSEFAAARKTALLLHRVGTEAQRVFHSQPSLPKPEGEDNYDAALRQLRLFYSPQVNVIVERFSFRRRV